MLAMVLAPVRTAPALVLLGDSRQPMRASRCTLQSECLAGQRTRLERLSRYVLRSAIDEKRLSLTSRGRVRYAFKSREFPLETSAEWRDGSPPVVGRVCLQTWASCRCSGCLAGSQRQMSRRRSSSVLVEASSIDPSAPRELGMPITACWLPLHHIESVSCRRQRKRRGSLV